MEEDPQFNLEKFSAVGADPKMSDGTEDTTHMLQNVHAALFMLIGVFIFPAVLPVS